MRTARRRAETEPPHRIARLILAVLVFSALGACGGGGSSDSGAVQNGGMATLTWVAPTQRVNGDFLDISKLAGYRVYAGQSTSNMQMVGAIDNPYQTNYVVSGLPSGTYYFYVTAVDTAGLESPPSEIKGKTI